MRRPPEKASRRGVLVSTVLGVATGGAWGAALQAFARPRRPRLSVIGDGSGQLALLDTTDVRVLVILGDAERLLGELPAVMTTFRQRIDLVIGTDRSLHGMGAARSRWNVRHTIAVPDDSRIAFTGADITRVHQDLAIDLGSRGTLEVRVTMRNAWRTDIPTRFLWITSWQSQGHRALLAPDGRSLRELGQPGAALAVVPDVDPATIQSELRPAALAINRNDDVASPPPGLHLVRIYPADVAEFDLRDDGIALPSWSTRG